MILKKLKQKVKQKCHLTVKQEAVKQLLYKEGHAFASQAAKTIFFSLRSNLCWPESPVVPAILTPSSASQMAGPNWLNTMASASGYPTLSLPVSMACHISTHCHISIRCHISTRCHISICCWAQTLRLLHKQPLMSQHKRPHK